MTITKPTADQVVWTPDEDDVEVQGSAKQSLGFVFREKFGSKVANWFFKRFSTWINWLIARVDAHETREDVTYALSASTFDEIQEFFTNLKHNDYLITITGGIADESKTLDISGITGTGTIRFNGASITLGALTIDNVHQTLISFDNEYGTNIAQKSQYGIRITNSSNVYLRKPNISFEEANSANWLLLSVEKSIVTINEPNFNGIHSGESAPTNLIRITSSSIVNINQDYAIETAETAGTTLARAMIFLEEGSVMNFDTTITYSSDWEDNYACQVEAVVYPDSDNIFYFSFSPTALTYTKEILAKVKEVNGTIEKIAGLKAISDLELRGIIGSGTINFDLLQFVLDNIIDGCTCNINILNSYVLDSATDAYSLSITNSSNVVFETRLYISTTTHSYGGLLVENSKVIIDEILYISEPVGHTSYMFVNKNSQVFIGNIISGNADIGYSAFMEIDGGSSVSIKAWVSNHVTTTEFSVNLLTGGSTMIGYTDPTDKYVLFTNYVDVSITEM